MNKNVVLVTGYAKAPEGTSMHQVFRHAGVVLAINPENDTIEDAECTFVTDLAKEFFRDLLVGYDLNQGLGPIQKDMEERYLAPSQQAVMMAVRTAVQRYTEKKQKKSPAGRVSGEPAE